MTQKHRPQSLSSNTTEQLFLYLDRIEAKLDRCEWKIGRSYSGIMQSIGRLGDEIMSELTDALDFAETTATEDASADSAAKALLITLSDMVKALGNGVNDPALVARIKALGDGIRSRAADLSAAVVANTPSAPGGSTGGVSGSTGGV